MDTTNIQSQTDTVHILVVHMLIKFQVVLHPLTMLLKCNVVNEKSSTYSGFESKWKMSSVVMCSLVITTVNHS